MNSDCNFTWQEIIRFPLAHRMSKPRINGLTMIIDKGMGILETRDLLNTSGDYIDLIKLGFGTSALYRNATLIEKINLAKDFNIDIYPGGTFLETAIVQDKLEEYLCHSKHMGFTCIEVSDGTINLHPEIRAKAISRAGEMGFKVLTEVGKKNENDKVPVKEMAVIIRSDLKNGAHKVILEGRESGTGVGLYDKEGGFIKSDFEQLLKEIDDPSQIIWEAPQKDQQVELISRFGPNVNFGNIPTHEVLAVEALRVGLRSDTLKLTL